MDHKEYAEEIIRKYLPSETSENAEYARTVTEAMNYAMTSGGKRIRPVLMYLTFKAFGGEGEIIEPFMAAIEMIHNYSLVHDDILDNDEMRHGKPAVHIEYGKDMALLAGDGLLNMAFETAAKAFSIAPGDERVERAVSILCGKAGLYGMLGGQAADVSLTGKRPSDEELSYIYRNKTGALIECAMVIGAILACADDCQAENVERAAAAAGMAFQVQDDILDITGDAEKLGKDVGQDENNDKYTYARIWGLDKAAGYVEEMTGKAAKLLEDALSGAEQRDDDHARQLMDLLISLAGREI